MCVGGGRRGASGNLLAIPPAAVYGGIPLISTHGIGRSKRGARDARTPWESKFFYFQFSAKELQNNPNLGIGAPSRKNPVSATIYNAL